LTLQEGVDALIELINVVWSLGETGNSLVAGSFKDVVGYIFSTILFIFYAAFIPLVAWEGWIIWRQWQGRGAVPYTEVFARLGVWVLVVFLFFPAPSFVTNLLADIPDPPAQSLRNRSVPPPTYYVLAYLAYYMGIDLASVPARKAIDRIDEMTGAIAAGDFAQYFEREYGVSEEQIREAESWFGTVSRRFKENRASITTKFVEFIGPSIDEAKRNPVYAFYYLPALIVNINKIEDMWMYYYGRALEYQIKEAAARSADRERAANLSGDYGGIAEEVATVVGARQAGKYVKERGFGAVLSALYGKGKTFFREAIKDARKLVKAAPSLMRSAFNPALVMSFFGAMLAKSFANSIFNFAIMMAFYFAIMNWLIRVFMFLYIWPVKVLLSIFGRQGVRHLTTGFGTLASLFVIPLVIEATFWVAVLIRNIYVKALLPMINAALGGMGLTGMLVGDLITVGAAFAGIIPVAVLLYQVPSYVSNLFGSTLENVGNVFKSLPVPYAK